VDGIRGVSARAFFRAPKGQLLIVLGILLLVAMEVSGMALTLPGVASAIVVAAIDAPILRAREGKWKFPDGALLTAMIIAMVLAPHEPWYVPAVATAIAILSKYVARTKTANIFNPAALALLVVFFLFGAEESWWGALSDAPLLLTALLVAGGGYMAVHLKKLPGVLAFLGVYFLAFTLASYAGDPAKVWEVFRAPDLEAVLYLALFMVTDPPTSPPRAKEQAQFGALAAAVTVVTYFTGGGAYFLLTGVLVANAWEAVRRTRWRARRASVPIVQ
jgi:Na+-translocating ferredoxin:NAD+ oxidoreductase RnfD subunit